jgi:hypothetical protein
VEGVRFVGDGPPPPRTVNEVLADLKAICEAGGGPAKAAEIVAALPDMPRAFLRDLLAVLAEGGA